MRGGKVQTSSSVTSTVIGRAMIAMATVNALSVMLYALEYYRTGRVVTTSGATAKGYHEIPAMLAGLTFGHQFLLSKLGNSLHRTLGYVAIFSTVVCLVMVIPNIAGGIRKCVAGAAALPIDNGSVLKIPVLVWNEAVNTHQFYLYKGLLLNQLYQGYHTAREKQFIAHRDHMQSAAMFLLGPMFQRFIFNHLADRQDEMGVLCQVVTYTATMIILYLPPVARSSIDITVGLAAGLAVVFVACETSSLDFILAMGETSE